MARVVYGELLQWQFGKSAIVTRGTKAIELKLDCCHNSVLRSIKQLAALHHIEILSLTRHRGRYMLMSPVFGSRRDLNDPVVKQMALKDGDLYRRLMKQG